MHASALIWVCLLSVAAPAVWARCPATCLCSEQAVRCIAAKLSAVPRDLPLNITHLAANGNFISTLPEKAFPTTSLTSLDLQSNGIASVRPGAFRGLVRLEYLDLAYNMLTTLGEGMFESLEELQELYLQFNKLKVIHKFTFRRLANLHTLDLSDNRLRTLDVWYFLNMNDAQFVKLSDNPLRCDCGVRDVWMWSVARDLSTGFNCTGAAPTEKDCVKNRPPFQVLALPTLHGFLAFAAIFVVSLVAIDFIASVYTHE